MHESVTESLHDTTDTAKEMIHFDVGGVGKSAGYIQLPIANRVRTRSRTCVWTKEEEDYHVCPARRG
jgi:hypothetical protein